MLVPYPLFGFQFYGNHGNGITKLANLKHLEVKIAADEDWCVLLLASCIEACPKLQKLVLEVYIYSCLLVKLPI